MYLHFSRKTCAFLMSVDILRRQNMKQAHEGVGVSRKNLSIVSIDRPVWAMHDSVSKLSENKMVAYLTNTFPVPCSLWETVAVQ